MLDTSLRPQTSPQSIRLIVQEPARGGHAVLLDNSSLTRIPDRESTEQQITGKVIVFTDSSGTN